MNDVRRAEGPSLYFLAVRGFVDDENDLAVLGLSLQPLFGLQEMGAIVHIDVEDEIWLRRHLANLVERTEAKIEDARQLAFNRFGPSFRRVDKN